MEKTSMENKRVFAGGLIAGAVLTLAVGGCAFVGVTLYQGTKNGSSLEEVGNKTTMEKVNVLEGMIDDYYLEDVSAEDLEQGVYKGLLDALGDPYSVYYTADELETLQEKTQGIYYGIGARVSLDTETQLPKIASVISGTPAEEAGLMANDLLYKADDTELQGMDLSSTVALIRGEEGTTVHLTVIRSGESNYLEFDVVRRKLANETVTSKMLDDSMAYIQIQEFDDVTLDQFTEDKYGNREEYSCDGTNPLEVPLVVLVDGNSASASEIMSGAVKDYGIGTLVGTTTYGKGIVQRIMQLTDNSAVKLTVSKYYTPKGNNIHKIGIEPDVEVEFDAQAYVEDGTDNQLNKAMEVLQEKMAE